MENFNVNDNIGYFVILRYFNLKQYRTVLIFLISPSPSIAFESHTYIATYVTIIRLITRTRPKSFPEKFD